MFFHHFFRPFCLIRRHILWLLIFCFGCIEIVAEGEAAVDALYVRYCKYNDLAKKNLLGKYFFYFKGRSSTSPTTTNTPTGEYLNCV